MSEWILYNRDTKDLNKSIPPLDKIIKIKLKWKNDIYFVLITNLDTDRHAYFKNSLGSEKIIKGSINFYWRFPDKNEMMAFL